MFGKFSILYISNYPQTFHPMASVKVIARKNKTNKKGLTPLYIQLVHNRKSKEISLKKYIDYKYWDKDNQKLRRGHNDAMLINVYIDNEVAAYKTVINKKLARSESFTLEDIVKLKNGKIIDAPDDGSFISFMENYTKENPEGLQYNTIKSYDTALNKVREFAPKLKFDEFTYEWLLSFEKHMENQGNKINTINDKFKVLKKITRLARQKEYMSKNPFDNYTQKTETSKREFLTREELTSFENYEPSQPSYILVKDVFLFSCYTGLRFSDLATITKNDVETYRDENNAKQYRLRVRMQKTNDFVVVRLIEKALSILHKYEFPKVKKYLFPILPDGVDSFPEKEFKITINKRNSYFNKVTKKLCQKVGIEKKITMHCARHTFATLSISFGMPIEIVSKLLGHKNIRETQVYIKILDNQRDAAMEIWNTL